jgi:cyclohexa-1,5-dienecarbonyl-CoA hydratase
MEEAMTEIAQNLIDVARTERTAQITLNRPPLNVMNVAMLRVLGQALRDTLPQSDVVVLQAEGRAFSVGVEVKDHVPEKVPEMLAVFHDVFRQLAKSDCLTIAAVQGYCLGGGMELATFCDFVVAEETASFAQPEIKLGCFPPVAMVTFPVISGPRAALDLILTGRTITAAEAQALGFVSRLAPAGGLAHAVQGLLAELNALSPAALRITRRVLRQRMGSDFDAELAAMERLYLDDLMKTADAQEGIRAFMEKRAPVWRGV